MRQELRSTCSPKSLPMSSFLRKVRLFLKNEDGPTSVEYAVMLSLIIVVCITAVTSMGKNANQAFSYVGSNVKGR